MKIGQGKLSRRRLLGVEAVLLVEDPKERARLVDDLRRSEEEQASGPRGEVVKLMPPLTMMKVPTLDRTKYGSAAGPWCWSPSAA